VNGGDKDWGRYPPYRELGYDAARDARREFDLGSCGAGTGALVATLKGGLGSASTKLDNGYTVGALAAVNAMGTATIAGRRHFWAAPFELDGEYGGLGYPTPFPSDATDVKIKFADLDRSGANTTIAVIATDARLTKAEAKRLAIAAHDGFAHAIWPTHTPFDGDLVFALATGTSGTAPDVPEFVELYAAAGATMARAISRGVHAATAVEGDIMPAWSSLPED
jgi:L-aminopeptidase/D-esterase-like protein